jgi:hypothetical protein
MMANSFKPLLRAFCLLGPGTFSGIRHYLAGNDQLAVSLFEPCFHTTQ